jgi:methylated-DNA-[protein]-cysteine S-methyltransferase
MTNDICWTVFEHAHLKLYIAATEKGLCYVGSPGHSCEEFATAIHKRFPAAELKENIEIMHPYIEELHEYFAGKRLSFSRPIDVKGTPFQEAIWQALMDIPYGQTLAYSDIAHKIDKPAAVRAVGTAIGANPVLITIPCHRVIGKNGAITGYRGGTEMKQYLLDLEGKKK